MSSSYIQPSAEDTEVRPFPSYSNTITSPVVTLHERVTSNSSALDLAGQTESYAHKTFINVGEDPNFYPQWQSTDTTGWCIYPTTPYTPENQIHRSMDTETVHLIHRFLISVRDEGLSNIQMLEKQIDYLNSLLEKSRSNYQSNDHAVQTYESMMGLGGWGYMRTGNAGYSVPNTRSAAWRPGPGYSY
ncbi:hypothetical protein QCA50_005495 [Cerrena zonata]|uniref:Uncharacterized protein n=1 Tax=Cerrena zonata TaxID=2478898 RepID=A0AAW0GLS3_9APHY